MSRKVLAGVEVPIPSLDAMRWVDIAVPSEVDLSATSMATPPSRDSASCSMVGEFSRYVVRRIYESTPRVLELFEFSAGEDLPGFGLRISFPVALFHGAFVVENEFGAGREFPYLLYAMTITGVAYLIKLRNISAYSSCAIFCRDDVVECNLRGYFNDVSITSVAASPGCLFVGRSDGLISTFQLGVLESGSPGFMHEIRDDFRFSRLWDIVSRSRSVAPVHDIHALVIDGWKVLLALHLDGTLRAWDLKSRSRLMCYTLSDLNLEGPSFVRLWVGKNSSTVGEVPAAILCRHVAGSSMETIFLLKMCFTPYDNVSISAGPVVHSSPLEDGRCIDSKLTSSKLWILKEKALSAYHLSDNFTLMKEEKYRLQNEFVAEQLFQNESPSLDRILCEIHSIVLSSKENFMSFVSSIFIRRLFHSGVYQQAVMRLTFMNYRRHFSESEFQSLTFEGLKNDILSLVENEGLNTNLVTVLEKWKHFCHVYFNNWCKNNVLCCMIGDPSSIAIGVLRKSSISSLRGLENIEQIIDGVCMELADSISPLPHSSLDNENGVLTGIVECIMRMRNQLGMSASAMFYESVLSIPDSCMEIFSCFKGIIENGYTSSASSINLLNRRNDLTRQNEISNRKNSRKFSVEMLLSLSRLHRNATSWSKVFSGIEGLLQYLVPSKTTRNITVQIKHNINSSIWAEAVSQISKLMFEVSVDILLFANYLCSIGRQIHMSDIDITRIQLELCPMIQEIMFDWIAVYFLSSAPSEVFTISDFNSQLSSLQIDGIRERHSWKDKLGKNDFKLVNILMPCSLLCSQAENHVTSNHFLSGEPVVYLVCDFTSWFLWGDSGNEASCFFNRSIYIASILLRFNQYNGVESLLKIVETNSLMEKTCKRFQDTGSDWCLLQHLLGCCFLAQGKFSFCEDLKDKKVNESIRCFFRASSEAFTAQRLQSLSCDDGLPYMGLDGYKSSEGWKLQYYQWVMQLFEQYEISGGACQFALAAVEQVDEAYLENDLTDKDGCMESVTAVKGRLWANVFKFMLDLNRLQDAYCSLLTNPDEESKHICLRRFINVLYERGAMKELCDGQLPFIGLSEKIEQELTWKAERSDVFAKPNPYKFLYAFAMQRHNWRKTATYMYQYSNRLKLEVVLKDQQHKSSVIQERLNALSASINALNLVHPHSAWIDPLPKLASLPSDSNPNKKFKLSNNEQGVCLYGHPSTAPQHYVSIEDLDKEFVLTSAEYVLSLVDGASAAKIVPSDLVDRLVEANLYDMALTVVLKFWKGSSLIKELGRLFSAMSLQFYFNKVNSSNFRVHERSKGEIIVFDSKDAVSTSGQPKWNTDWETIESYLKKYRALHEGLPLIVAESLLRTDSQMELPLWLVHMFKDGGRERTWSVTGSGSNWASLFRLYVNHGRYTEATNMLLEYIDLYSSVRPSDLVNRKRPMASWLPYTAIELLWCQLDELSSKSGQIGDHCEKLKKLLYLALQKHLNLLKVDSEDAIASSL